MIPPMSVVSEKSEIQEYSALGSVSASVFSQGTKARAISNSNTSMRNSGGIRGASNDLLIQTSQTQFSNDLTLSALVDPNIDGMTKSMRHSNET